jgi:hypothetical protein
LSVVSGFESVNEIAERVLGGTSTSSPSRTIDVDVGKQRVLAARR